jgi:hypothetical protein
MLRRRRKPPRRPRPRRRRSGAALENGEGAPVSAGPLFTFRRIEMNDQQKLAIRDLLQALLDAVKAHGDSIAPSGHLYATVMGVMRLDQYEQLIEALVALRCIRRGPCHPLFHVQDLTSPASAAEPNRSAPHPTPLHRRVADARKRAYGALASVVRESLRAGRGSPSVRRHAQRVFQPNSPNSPSGRVRSGGRCRAAWRRAARKRRAPGRCCG